MKEMLLPGSRVRVKDTPELRRVRKWPCGKSGTVICHHDWLFGGPVNLYAVQIDRGEKILAPPRDLTPVRPQNRRNPKLHEENTTNG